MAIENKEQEVIQVQEQAENLSQGQTGTTVLEDSKRYSFTGIIPNAILGVSTTFGKKIGSNNLEEKSEKNIAITNKGFVFYLKSGDLFKNELGAQSKRLFLYKLGVLAQYLSYNKFKQVKDNAYRNEMIRQANNQPFNVDEYIRDCVREEKPNTRKKMIQSLRESISDLFNVMMDYSFTDYKGTEHNKKTRILSSIEEEKKGGVLKGNCYLRLEQDLVIDIINSGTLIRYPKQIYKLDINRYAKSLTLSTYFINLANQSRNQIKLTSLLKEFDYTSFILWTKDESKLDVISKSYEQDAKNYFRAYSYLLEPLKRNLEYLKGDGKILKSYKIQDSKGKRVLFENINKHNVEDIVFLFELTEQAQPLTDQELELKKDKKENLIEKKLKAIAKKKATSKNKTNQTPAPEQASS